MNNKLFIKLSLMGILIFFFTLLSPPWAGLNLGTVQAQMKPVGGGDSNTLGASLVHQCTIFSIAAVEVDSTTFPNENRIYVRCTNPASQNISYFASAVGTNGGTANRYLVMLNTAFALGKIVAVYYDNTAGNNPIGCQPTDCRKLTGLVLGP